MVNFKERSFRHWTCYNQNDLSACCMDLKFLAHAYVQMRNSNLNSVFYKDQRLFIVIAQ